MHVPHLIGDAAYPLKTWLMKSFHVIRGHLTTDYLMYEWLEKMHERKMEKTAEEI